LFAALCCGRRTIFFGGNARVAGETIQRKGAKDAKERSESYGNQAQGPHDFSLAWMRRHLWYKRSTICTISELNASILPWQDDETGSRN
jgi:hypothetical protein